jgi:hypothetical protein
MGGAVLLVRANLKAGRADRRGAGRVALFLLAVWGTAWRLGARHSFVVGEETNRLFTATGVMFLLVASGDTLVALVSGALQGQPQTSNMQYLVGARYAIANMLRMLPNALQSAMIGAFLYIVLFAIVRRHWIAGTLVLAMLCGIIFAEAGGERVWLSLLVVAVAGPVTIIVFLRFGLFAIATALWVNQLLQIIPLTADPSRPHAGVSALAMPIVMATAAYAFHVSRAGDGLLRRLVPQA